MSLDIDNKVYRNMQEQVCANARNIVKIKEYLDGIQVEDKLVVIDASSGTISDKELEILMQSLAFISYNNGVYIKVFESTTEIVFKLCNISAAEVGSAYFNIGGSKIVIIKSTKAYEVQNDAIITVYSKAQIDSIIANIMALKADKSELNEKADLSGATFTGTISGPNITEINSGYSFTRQSSTQINDIIYAGIVKTGNKITFVTFVRFTANGSSFAVGNFRIPSDIGAKIYPTNYGSDTNWVDSRLITGSISASSAVSFVARLYKNSESEFIVNFRSEGTSSGTTYVARYEVTFLLSDNLAA